MKCRFPPWAFAAFGLAAFLLLQLHYALAWSSYYVRFPMKGYELAMAAGEIPPYMMSSSRSFLLGLVVLVALPLATLWFRSAERRSSLIGLWSGVVLALIAVWVGTERLRQDSNMWPIDVMFLLLITAVPLGVGAWAQAWLESVIRFRSESHGSVGETPPDDSAA